MKAKRITLGALVSSARQGEDMISGASFLMSSGYRLEKTEATPDTILQTFVLIEDKKKVSSNDFSSASVGFCEVCGGHVIGYPDGMGKLYCAAHKQEVKDL